MFEKFKDWMELQKNVRISTMGHVPPPPPPLHWSDRRLHKEVRARKENPAVKDAWEKYQITLKLVIGEEIKQPEKFGKRSKQAYYIPDRNEDTI